MRACHRCNSERGESLVVMGSARRNANRASRAEIVSSSSVRGEESSSQLRRLLLPAPRPRSAQNVGLGVGRERERGREAAKGTRREKNWMRESESNSSSSLPMWGLSWVGLNRSRASTTLLGFRASENDDATPRAKENDGARSAATMYSPKESRSEAKPVFLLTA